MNTQFPDTRRDYTECPGDPDCKADKGPYGMTYAHKHCAIDGCPLMAEGGGGDDGFSIGGYTNAVYDSDLDELVNQYCYKANEALYRSALEQLEKSETSCCGEWDAAWTAGFTWAYNLINDRVNLSRSDHYAIQDAKKKRKEAEANEKR